MRPQRKKFMMIASAIPIITAPAIVMTNHLHGEILQGFALLYAVSMLFLLGYVVSQLVKMKRSAR
jgi:hypothetical protein